MHAGKSSRVQRLLLAGALAGCNRGRPIDHTEPREASATVVSVPSAAAREIGLAPLAGEWLQELKDGEAPVGFVAVPIGATGPRPVAIILHGAGDRPDWECPAWRAILGPRPFIVCPCGKPHPAWKDTFVWSSATHARTAIAVAMKATDARFAGYIGAGPRVLGSFSQGALMGASIVAQDGGTYPFAFFLEGLGDLGASSFAVPFKKAGGQRVVLGCSQAGCAPPREALRKSLSAKGVEARVNDAGAVGHTIDGVVIASIRRDVSWLLEGSPEWSAVAAEHQQHAR